MSGWYDLEITLRAAASLGRRPRPAEGPVDLLLCLVDHFEPQVGKPPREQARARLEDWLERYPQVAGRHRDADGRVPAHSFFYPWDECDDWELEQIAALCAEGWGELEIHLHHENDTDATLRTKLREAIAAYSAHGGLSRWPDGRPAWGFVHGNWALDNSRHENGCNFCGVNNELDLLREEGCYADFTFPSWQKPTQPRQVNSIYYATDDPLQPKSYEWGIPARAGREGDARSLLLIQGPLAPHIRKRRGLPLPAMDDGDLAGSPARRYRPERLDRWVRAAPTVLGRPDRLFVKLHCHGAADSNREPMLGKDLEAMFADAEARYNDGRRYRLHYLTAREMFNVVKATEANAPGDIHALRDWLLPPPAHRQARTATPVTSGVLATR